MLGAEIQTPFQIVPQGLQAINGSKSDMGCSLALVDVDGLMSCGGPNNPSVSFLSDGVSPDIYPCTANWASGLVTVKKNAPTDNVHYDHVVLTFGFDTNVTLTAIELDVFLCPEWNISTPYIALFGGAKDSLIFRADGDDRDFLVNYHPSEPSCGCLSTVRMPIQQGEPSYTIWHIVVSFHLQQQIQWVHVGEVRFLDTSIEPGSPPTTFCRLPDPTSSELYTQHKHVLREEVTGIITVIKNLCLHNGNNTETLICRSREWFDCPWRKDTGKKLRHWYIQRVPVALLYYKNSVCVLECRHVPILSSMHTVIKLAIS